MNRFITRFLLAVSVFSISPSASAAIITDNGTNRAYSLVSGDTLRIASGNYRGNINAFPAGSVILVSSGATFYPNALATPAGTITNYGTVYLNYGISTSTGFRVNNYGIFTIKGDVNMNGTQTWNNYYGGRINFLGVTLAGTLYNEGTIESEGTFNMNSGSIQNKFILNMKGVFTVNSGQVSNEGEMDLSSITTINSGITYTNKCRMEPNGGLRINGVLRNEGLLWLGKSGSVSSEFTNNGTFASAGGVVKGVTLTNSGFLNGNGYFYFTGHTASSGIVGTSGITADSLKFYDVSRTNSLRVFDQQSGIVYPNAFYRVSPPPDTIRAYSGCSDLYKSYVPLPLTWTYFHLQGGAQPELSWGASQDATFFEVERAYGKEAFRTLATLQAHASGRYTYTDATLNPDEPVVCYRIKGISKSGEQKVSVIKTLQASRSGAMQLSLHPNPATSAVSLSYTPGTDAVVYIRMSTVSGQTLFTRTVSGSAKTGLIPLPEVQALKPGVYVVELTGAQNRTIGSTRLVKQ